MSKPHVSAQNSLVEGKFYSVVFSTWAYVQNWGLLCIEPVLIAQVCKGSLEKPAGASAARDHSENRKNRSTLHVTHVCDCVSNQGAGVGSCCESQVMWSLLRMPLKQMVVIQVYQEKPFSPVWARSLPRLAWAALSSDLPCVFCGKLCLASATVCHVLGGALGRGWVRY